MTKHYLIISLSLSLIPLHSFANESNLENFTYPSHECGKKSTKPKQPARHKQINENDDNPIVEYNLKVATYNKNIKTYKSCINQYIQNGNHDINIIRNELNEALKEARSK